MNSHPRISPAYATDSGYRVVVLPGHNGRRETLPYRALAPDGDGGSRPTANHSLLTANSSYTFSAKERDTETGLSYFGSRYYSSDLSIWLSVDPMAAKYASLSPYNYCANNPVKLVDPNGEEVLEDKPPGKIAQKLSNLESKVEGSADNRQFEGHSDGANTGVITKEDVKYGFLVAGSYVTFGAAMEAEGATSIFITVLSAANDIDDATVDSNGETFFQRISADKPAVNKSVNFIKSASSGASALSSTKTVEKKGIQKSPYSLADAVKSTYNYVKSFFSKNRNNGQS